MGKLQTQQPTHLDETCVQQDACADRVKHARYDAGDGRIGRICPSHSQPCGDADGSREAVQNGTGIRHPAAVTSWKVERG